MNVKLRSRVYINVLLNRFFLGKEDIGFETSVKHSESSSHSPEHSEFNKRHECTNNHGLLDSTTDIYVPITVKVSVGTLKSSVKEWNTGL